MKSKRNKCSEGRTEDKAVESGFTIIIEESKDILSDEEIHDLLVTFARAMAYEYIADHPELFDEVKESEDSSSDEGDETAATPIFRDGRCDTISEVENGGSTRCAA